MGQTSNSQPVIEQPQTVQPNFFSQVITALEGKKTYLVAFAMIVYALTGWYLGDLNQSSALFYIFNALGFSGLRAGIAKLG